MSALCPVNWLPKMPWFSSLSSSGFGKEIYRQFVFQNWIEGPIGLCPFAAARALRGVMYLIAFLHACQLLVSRYQYVLLQKDKDTSMMWTGILPILSLELLALQTMSRHHLIRFHCCVISWNPQNHRSTSLFVESQLYRHWDNAAPQRKVGVLPLLLFL